MNKFVFSLSLFLSHLFFYWSPQMQIIHRIFEWQHRFIGDCFLGNLGVFVLFSTLNQPVCLNAVVSVFLISGLSADAETEGLILSHSLRGQTFSMPVGSVCGLKMYQYIPNESNRNLYVVACACVCVCVGACACVHVCVCVFS